MYQRMFAIHVVSTFVLLQLLLLAQVQSSSSTVPVLCNHASTVVQKLLQETRSSVTSFYDLQGPYVPLKFEVFDGIKGVECTTQNSAPFVFDTSFIHLHVEEDEVLCSSKYIVSSVNRQRISSVVSQVAAEFGSMLRVSYQPEGSPLYFFSEFQECGVDNFGMTSTESNAVLLLTFTPFPEDTLWQNVSFWVVPCAWDSKGRPLVIRLNFNPEAASELQGTNLESIVKHALIHGLGFNFFNNSSVEIEQQFEVNLTRNVSYLKNMSDYLVEQYDCPATPSMGLPLDDEYRLTQLHSSLPKGGAHWESRVVWHDVMSAGIPTKDVSGATLGFFKQHPLYQIQETFSPSKSRGSSKSPCAVLTNKCNTTLGQAHEDWCFSLDLSLQCCSYDGKTVLKCNQRSWPESLPSYFQYFSSSMEGGNSMDQDFCPTIHSTVTSCITSSGGGEGIQAAKGNVYGASSRCFHNSNVKKSSVIGSQLDVWRCFKVKCPFGVRIEFQLFQSSVWHPCPLDGSEATVALSGEYTGSVSCPAARSICSEELIPLIVAPWWKTVSGYAIEYTLLALNSSFEDGARGCKAVDASLPFLPDENFANTMMADISSSSAFWVNRNSTTWSTMYSYPESLLTAESLSECNIYDPATQKVTAGVNCSVNLPLLCTRSLQQYRPKNCTEGTFCSFFNGTNLTQSATYFLPLRPVLKTESEAIVSCTASAASFFSDQTSNLSTFDEVNCSFSKISEALHGESIVILRTNLTHMKSNSVLPAWKEFVRNWDDFAQNEQQCFGLMASSNTTLSLQLQSIPCAGKFPALCQRSLLLHEGVIDQEVYKVAVVTLPLSKESSLHFCQELQMTLTPLISSHFGLDILKRTQQLLNSSYLDSSMSAFQKIRLGVERTSTALVAVEFDPYPVPVSGQTSFVPSNPSDLLNPAALGEVFVKNAVGSAFEFSVGEDPSALHPFACAVYAYPLKEGTGRCANATWCWASDASVELLFVQNPPCAASAVAQHCQTLQATSLFSTTSDAAAVLNVVANIFGSSIIAAWMGMKFGGGGFESDGKALTFLDPLDEEFVEGSFQDGDCVSLFWSSRKQKYQLTAKPCGFPLPFVCRHSTTVSSWAKVDEAINIEYAFLSGAVTLVTGRKQCQSFGGDLAYFPFNASTGLFMLNTLGNQLNMSSSSRAWFGLQNSNDTAFNYTFLLNSTTETPNAECYSVRGNGTVNPENCSQLLPVLCARFSQVANATVPTSARAGVSFSVTLQMPAGVNETGAAKFNISTNSSELVPSNIVSLASSGATNITVSVPCTSLSGNSSLYYIRFYGHVMEDTLGVQKLQWATTLPVMLLYPCLQCVTSNTSLTTVATRSFSVTVSCNILHVNSSILVVPLLSPLSSVSTLTPSNLTFTSVQSSMAIFLNVSAAGLFTLNFSISDCNPTSLCEGVLIDVPQISIRSLYHNQLDWQFPSAPFYVGSRNMVNASIRALHSLSPGTATVMLSSNLATLFFPRNEFLLTSTESVFFQFSSSAPGTAALSARLEVGETDSLFRNQTVDLGVLLFQQPQILQFKLNTLRGGMEVFPGEEFSIDIMTSSSYVFSADQGNVTLYIPSSSYYEILEGSSFTFSNSTCCDWTGKFAAVRNISQVSSEGARDKIFVVVKSEFLGGFSNQFLLPLALPSFAFVLKKYIHVTHVPSQIFVRGNDHQPVQFYLDQAPIRNASIRFLCNASNSIAVSTPMPLMIPSGNYSQTKVEMSISLTADPRIIFLPGVDTMTVHCWLQLEESPDLFITPRNYTMKLRTKTRTYISGKVPSKVAPGEAFTINVTVVRKEGDPYATISPKFNASIGVSLRQTSTLVTSTLNSLWVFYLAVAESAEPTKVFCVSFDVSHPNRFEILPTECTEIISLVSVSVTTTSVFKFTQPVGSRNRQTFSLSLSSVPILRNISCAILCVPIRSSETAKFMPRTVVWSSQQAQALSVDVVVEGIVPLTNCDISVQVDGGSELKDGSRTFSAFGRPIVFVNLLDIKLQHEITDPALFVGEGNAKTISLSMPQAPSAAVFVSAHWDGKAGAIDIVPSNITFMNTSAGRLTQTFTIIGVVVTPLSTITLSVQTAAGEFNTDALQGKTIPVYVRSLYQIHLLYNSIDAVEVPLYCGGIHTATSLTVRLDGLPQREDDRVSLKLNGSGLITTSPLLVVFTSHKTQPLQRSLKLICLDTEKEQKLQVPVSITAPTEFVTPKPFDVILKPLEGFTVLNFPTKLWVGPFVKPFSIRPNRMAPHNVILELDMVSSCPEAIEMIGNGYSSAELKWINDVRPVSIRFIAKAAAKNCSVWFVLSPNSTAYNFAYFAFRGYLEIKNQPQISFFEPRSVRVFEAELKARRAWQFSVTDVLYKPTSEITLNASMEYIDQWSPCLVVSSSQPYDPLSLFSIWRSRRSVFNVTVDLTLNVLYFSIQYDDNIKVHLSEAITLTFTESCFQGTDVVPPKVGFDNFTFLVETEEENIVAVQRGVVNTAVIITAAASLAAGPALATAGAKLGILFDAGLCPMGDWEIRRQLNMAFVENPFNIKLGKREKLGGFLGAAVMDIVFALGWIGFHACLVFLLYAYRNDQAVADKSLGNSMAALKMPSLDLFPVVFFGPIIAKFALRVVMYSPVAAYRVAGVIPVLIVIGGVPWCLYYVIRLKGCFFDPVVSDAKYTIWQRLTRELGWWKLDRTLERVDDHFIDKYRMFFDHYMGKYKWFLLFDYGVAVLVNLLNAYEATTYSSCVAKYAIMIVIFVLFFLVTVIARPYRRHINNLFHGVICFAEVTSLLISFLALTGKNPTWGPRAASSCMVAIAGLLIIKSGMDMFILVLDGSIKFIIRHVKRKHLHNFQQNESEMTVFDVFPFLSREIEQEDEWEDTVTELVEQRRTRSVVLQNEKERAQEEEQHRKFLRAMI